MSQHALLRWLERAAGLDLRALQARIEANLAGASRAAEAIGGGDYVILLDGLAYVVREGTVTTVLDNYSYRSLSFTLRDRHEQP